MADDGRQPTGNGVVGELAPDDVPPLDADAVRRSYQRHRARRRARVEHLRRGRRAGARFWVVFLLLVAACVVIAMTTWREIGRLFGL
jgi:hypothetical protein